MKAKWLLVVATVCSLLFFAFIYLLLTLGLVAQRTYTFSVLKEFETTGLLKTNVTADDVLKTTAGNRLLQMNPTKTSHRSVFIASGVWMVLVLGGVVYYVSTPSSSR